MSRTRGACDDSKLNRTLHESPATVSLHSATPKKMFLALFCGDLVSAALEGAGFFLDFLATEFIAHKMTKIKKGVYYKYSFGVACLPAGRGVSPNRWYSPPAFAKAAAGRRVHELERA